MINVRVITPHGLYLSKTFKAVKCVSVEGEMTILPNHMPIVVMLMTSKLTLINEQREEFAISEGLLSFNENTLTILTDSIESKDEIDIERAERAKKQALENIKRAKESFELKQAELALARAINRLSVGNSKY